MRQRLVFAILSALTLTQSLPVLAQSNLEVNAGIQFDFISPGARSLALGGAFTAIADDATSAFANPAGLREISRKEASFDMRFRNFETPFTTRGHAFGNATGQGVDTITGLVDGTSQESTAAPAFLSFVYPGAKWAIAGYYHELAHFKSVIRTEGFFFGTAPSRAFPIDGELDMTILDYGVSGSYRVNDQVSIGAGVAFYDFQSDALTTRYSFAGNFFGPPTYTTPASRQTQNGDDTGIGFNVGVLLKPSGKVQLGAVYRKGAAFDISATNVSLPSNVTLGGGDGKFHIPDVFSLGVMVRPAETFRLSMDYSRVQYSQMTKDFVDLFAPVTNASEFSIDDGNEFHIGAEYFFANLKAPVALRGGAWFDPAHSLGFTGTDQFSLATFRARGDQWHYAFGGGIVIQRVELNAGADLSDFVNTFSVSTVIRF